MKVEYANATGKAIGYSFELITPPNVDGNWFVDEDVQANKFDYHFNFNGDKYYLTGVQLHELLKTGNYEV